MSKFNIIYPLIPVNNGEVYLPITGEIVPNIKPYYYISNYGNIYHRYIGRLMKPATDSGGYLFVTLSTDCGMKHCSIHRLVLLAFVPIQNSDKLQVNHIDGVKSNNFINNLEWCTRSENVNHAYRIGLHASYSNITKQQAITICELLSEFKYTNEQIANIVGCTTHNVASIKSGHAWKNLSKDYQFDYKIFRLFSENDIHKICQYFQSHTRNCCVNDFCREALAFLGMNCDDRYVDTVRKIYNRKYYTKISSLYEY